MHIRLCATALPGMTPGAVARIVRDAWLERRPSDVVDTRILSDGEIIGNVGTGLDDVFRTRFADAVADEASDPRRVRWVSPESQTGMLDLAEALTWNGEGNPRGSTSFLAEDLRYFRDRGIPSVHIHLPQLMRASDIGLGLLSELTGVDVSFDESSEELSAVLEKARSEIPMTLTVTFPADLRLIGVDGMARRWAVRGYDSQVAQDFERVAGQFVQNLIKAQQLGSRRSLIATQLDGRAAFAGVGGGLGFVLALLGGSVRSIGEFLLSHDGLREDTDLVVYVCAALGVDLPSGLATVTNQAERAGVPIVLVTDYAGLRRGELPRLGLHGSYELRPERAFVADDGGILEIADLPERLRDTTGRVAQTWGWD